MKSLPQVQICEGKEKTSKQLHCKNQILDFKNSVKNVHLNQIKNKGVENGKISLNSDIELDYINKLKQYKNIYLYIIE